MADGDTLSSRIEGRLGCRLANIMHNSARHMSCGCAPGFDDEHLRHICNLTAGEFLAMPAVGKRTLRQVRSVLQGFGLDLLVKMRDPKPMTAVAQRRVDDTHRILMVRVIVDFELTETCIDDGVSVDQLAQQIANKAKETGLGLPRKPQ